MYFTIFLWLVGRPGLYETVSMECHSNQPPYAEVGRSPENGRIELDPSKPNGQQRRCLDVTGAEREFGFRARTDFRTGLRQTIDWYEQHVQAAVAAGGGVAGTG